VKPLFYLKKKKESTTNITVYLTTHHHLVIVHDSEIKVWNVSTDSVDKIDPRPHYVLNKNENHADPDKKSLSHVHPVLGVSSSTSTKIISWSNIEVVIWNLSDLENFILYRMKKVMVEPQMHINNHVGLHYDQATREIVLWDFKEDKIVVGFSHRGRGQIVEGVYVMEDGKRAVIWTPFDVMIYDLSNRKVLQELSWSMDGELIGQAKIWSNGRETKMAIPSRNGALAVFSI